MSHVTFFHFKQLKPTNFVDTDHTIDSVGAKTLSRDQLTWTVSSIRWGPSVVPLGRYPSRMFKSLCSPPARLHPRLRQREFRVGVLQQAAGLAPFLSFFSVVLLVLVRRLQHHHAPSSVVALLRVLATHTCACMRIGRRPAVAGCDFGDLATPAGERERRALFLCELGRYDRTDLTRFFFVPTPATQCCRLSVLCVVPQSAHRTALVSS